MLNDDMDAMKEKMPMLLKINIIWYAFFLNIPLALIGIFGLPNFRCSQDFQEWQVIAAQQLGHLASGAGICCAQCLGLEIRLGRKMRLKIEVIHTGTLWNINMGTQSWRFVWFRWFSFAIGWPFSFQLIFRGVSWVCIARQKGNINISLFNGKCMRQLSNDNSVLNIHRSESRWRNSQKGGDL